MGRVLMEGEDNCLSVAGNLRKDRKIWMQMTRILIREGVDLKVSGLFFKAVVQEVLLFQGREMGTEPLDGASPENLPEQGCAAAHWEAAKAEGGG